MRPAGFRILIISVLGMIIISCVTKSSTPYNRQIVFRPITLIILDAETEQPVEGISVIVVNDISYYRPLIVPIDGTSGADLHLYEYMSNENGIVEIPQFLYNVNHYYYLNNQQIILNLEMLNSRVSKRRRADIFNMAAGAHTEGEESFFFRLRQEYKAGLICYHMDKNDYELSERSKPYQTAIYKKYETGEKQMDRTSFYCDRDEFVFYLERFVEPE